MAEQSAGIDPQQEITMSNLTFDAFCEIADNAGAPLVAYSGRNMYGAHCVALEVRAGKEFYILADLVAACDDTEIAACIVRSVQTDSFGTGAILYWPKIKCDENAEKAA